MANEYTETNRYIQGYHNGYCDALGLKEGLKCSIFGMDMKEVLEILSKHAEKKAIEKIVINHIDKGPIIVKRHGKIVYED